MKKYPKLIQCDARGQIVIPKDIRSELKIQDGTGFYVYSITDEGILFKKVPDHNLENDKSVAELREKSDKIGIKKESIDRTVRDYKKTKEGNLDII